MMQRYVVVPLHIHEFFECMNSNYRELDSSLMRVNGSLRNIKSYKINDVLIFVSNQPFQKKDLSSVTISGDPIISYLIKAGLEKQTGFKLLENKKWE